MVGLVIASHGKLSECMLNTVNLFVKNSENISTVNLEESSGSDEFSKKLENAINKVDDNDGVLILLDLFGGTPANISWNTISSISNCRGVTGINLGMLLEILIQRDNSKTLEELTETAQKAGEDGIKVLRPV
ncbi:MAG: PTS sugar transporter subunit IIA [Bacillota bacterium]